MSTRFARSLVVLATLGAVAVPAAAGPGKRRAPARKKPAAAAVEVDRAPLKKARAADCGDGFDLSRSRRSAPPSGDAIPVVELRALTDAQVGSVVKDRRADVEYCWLRVPADHRAATTAVLRFAIDSTGEVTAADVTGVPAAARTCIATAAAAWTFPAADVASDVEYAIELR